MHTYITMNAPLVVEVDIEVAQKNLWYIRIVAVDNLIQLYKRPALLRIIDGGMRYKDVHWSHDRNSHSSIQTCPGMYLTRLWRRMHSVSDMLIDWILAEQPDAFFASLFLRFCLCLDVYPVIA
jgi:hypothetical protein